MKVGIIGGGQLGRMLALAGYPLGLRCTVLEPTDAPAAGQVCSQLRGEYDDYRSLYELVQASDVITYEFENVPVLSAEWLAERRPVYPPPAALQVSQDRIHEKDFFRELGIPTPPFAAIHTREQFEQALATIGLPSVLKTRRFGYDGKGQAVLRTPADARTAWETLGGRPLILEGFVPFDCELSLVSVRGADGTIRHYPLVQNTHQDGMLALTLAPAPRGTAALQRQAEQYAERVLARLNYVGVLAIEWFWQSGADGGQLIANEMAPRVHNSGHWTQDGAVTSQFENHLRAVTGLPLGATMAIGHSAMINLIGQHPPFAAILSLSGAKLHWYGKEPKPRRKIGHVNFRCDSAAERDAVVAAWQSRFGKLTSSTH